MKYLPLPEIKLDTVALIAAQLEIADATAPTTVDGHRPYVTRAQNLVRAVLLDTTEAQERCERAMHAGGKVWRDFVADEGLGELSAAADRIYAGRRERAAEADRKMLEAVMAKVPRRRKR